MNRVHAARPLRVAIIGLGPKGLYALERLIHHSHRLPARSIELTVYEPHPAPGAGPVYDPDQPSYLRMNFAAELVDMWPDGEGPSFVEWRRQTGGLGVDAYPPRSHVGRYLSEGFERLVATAPDSISIEVRTERVGSLSRESQGWVVAADGPRKHDEVLIATGHEDGWDGALAEQIPASELPQATVFPVDHELSSERIPPGATVAVRGFALTMIDAALALTEGRGGRFTEGREPYLLRYEPCGDEPAAILPWSRTGRPMLAKPDPGHAIRSRGIDEAAARARAELLALPAGAGLLETVRVIANVATESLRAAAPDEPREGLEDLLGSATQGVPLPGDLPPEEGIERSIAVAMGAAVPGRDWALGHTWRALYPALVERLGADGLAAEEWPAFHMLAREMERIAFGPPPVNAAKLLALIEAGNVDLSHSTAGPSPHADVIVDAVLPPPGAAGARQPLLEGIVRDRLARIPQGRRGIEITRDVECVGADGSLTHGLGVIGRPTEDWVIGNDTLNRVLHPQPERWALRVAGRAAS